MFGLRTVIAALTALLVGAALIGPWPLGGPGPEVRQVSLSARQFAFEPFEIWVNLGDTVTIDLEAIDSAHGLFLDGYDVNIQAEPGQRARATFVADKPGRYRFRCSVACGNLHPFMIGEILVDPNVPFERAVAATVVAAVGSLAFFWKR